MNGLRTRFGALGLFDLEDRSEGHIELLVTVRLSSQGLLLYYSR